MDYKDKIKKLLKLAESPNEHEAKSALLKARKLMACHKLGQKALEEKTGQEVKSIMSPITCSKRRSPWVMPLASVIGEHYCCKAYQSHMKGKQTFTTCFLGFPDDLELCGHIFEYAVNCVQSNIQCIQKRNKGKYDAKSLKTICDSYGYGFAEGIKDAFEQQQEENKGEWGLILSVPKEVEDVAERIITGRISAKINMHDLAYERGRKHGKAFDPDKKLPG